MAVIIPIGRFSGKALGVACQAWPACQCTDRAVKPDCPRFSPLGLDRAPADHAEIAPPATAGWCAPVLLAGIIVALALGLWMGMHR